MRWISMTVVAGMIVVSASVLAMAQSDVCAPEPIPTRSDQERVEAMKIEAAARAEREAQRGRWDVKMFSVKNDIPASTLRALCIFRVEVVPQSALHVVQIRAPKEIMPEVEDAMKRLDVPSPMPKNLELTAYVLVNGDSADPRDRLSPLPSSLQPVANQLKGLVPDGMWFLADSVIARGTDGQFLRMQGSTDFMVTPQIRETGGTLNVHLTNLAVSTRGASFNTTIDVPVGTQTVVGKSTSGSSSRAVVLVLTAKILN